MSSCGVQVGPVEVLFYIPCVRNHSMILNLRAEIEKMKSAQPIRGLLFRNEALM